MKLKNRRHPTTLLSALVLVVGVLVTGDSGATYGTCVAPTDITMPNALKSESDAISWSADVKSYLDASEQYLQCLRDYGNANLATMSKREEAKLREELDRYVNSLRQTAEVWNNIHGEYLSKQAKRPE